MFWYWIWLFAGIAISIGIGTGTGIGIGMNIVVGDSYWALQFFEVTAITCYLLPIIYYLRPTTYHPAK